MSPIATRAICVTIVAASSASLTAILMQGRITKYKKLADKRQALVDMMLRNYQKDAMKMSQDQFVESITRMTEDLKFEQIVNRLR